MSWYSVDIDITYMYSAHVGEEILCSNQPPVHIITTYIDTITRIYCWLLSSAYLMFKILQFFFVGEIHYG